jgi:hypothetical protein
LAHLKRLLQQRAGWQQQGVLLLPLLLPCAVTSLVRLALGCPLRPWLNHCHLVREWRQLVEQLLQDRQAGCLQACLRKQGDLQQPETKWQRDASSSRC